MLKGSCLCGAVRFEYSVAPDAATACNCTACRRYGALWIYDYENEGIRIEGETRAYVRGKALQFHFCGECGCVTHWRGLHLEEDGRRRMAVNVRLCDPQMVADIPLQHFEGLESFEDLPQDGKCVRDYWF
jgi:hypothetical protein